MKNILIYTQMFKLLHYKLLNMINDDLLTFFFLSFTSLENKQNRQILSSVNRDAQ